MTTISLELSVGLMPSDTDDPSTITIKPELEILKPALLYGDKTTLYSPHILLLHHLDKQRHSSTADPLALIHNDFLRAKWPDEIAEVERNLRWVEETKAKPFRTPEEDAALQAFAAIPEKSQKEYERTIRPKLDRQLNSTGYKQIRKAIKEGLLSITPIVSDEVLDHPDRLNDVLMGKYVEHIEQIMQKPGTYPLFDTFSADVVKALVQDGRLPAEVLGSSHGKQVSFATQLIRRLPTFPKADVYDIIDIRKELRKPLVRFRSATMKLGALIEAPVFGEAFEAAVNDLIYQEIEPAIQEIEEETQRNRSLRRLRHEAVGSTGTLISSLAIAVASGVNLPTLFAAVLVGQVAQIATSTFKHMREAEEHIQQREMFFLTEMDRQLQRRIHPGS